MHGFYLFTVGGPGAVAPPSAPAAEMVVARSDHTTVAASLDLPRAVGTSVAQGRFLNAATATQPVEKFLELRYGPLTDPANRQRAFLDFFNIGHIKGLQILAPAAVPGAGRRGTR